MTKEQQQNHVNTFTEQMKSILLAKGNDYANEDVLSNFKLAGAIVGKDAVSNCLNFIGTKVVRLGNLLGNNKNPKNESVRDTLFDLANYCVLLDEILDENGI